MDGLIADAGIWMDGANLCVCVCARARVRVLLAPRLLMLLDGWMDLLDRWMDGLLNTACLPIYKNEELERDIHKHNFH